MFKKDKKEDDEIQDIDDFDEFDIDEYQYPETNYNDNMASNSMEYASIVSMPSKSAKSFEHVPKEIKYAFLDNMETREVKHWDKLYRHYIYLKKVLQLQAQEDVKILNNRLTLYKVKDNESLKNYCKDNHNLIAYNMIKDDPNKIKQLIQHIQTLQDNGFYEDIRNQNKELTAIYDEYRKNNKVCKFVDDLGMSGNIYTTGVVSMGRGGNERHATITSIQATKDMDLKKQQEERTEYKNKIGGFFKKFS